MVIRKTSLTVNIIVVFVASLCLSSIAVGAKKDIEYLQAEIDAAIADIATNTGDISTNTGDIDALLAAVAGLQSQLVALEARVSALEPSSAALLAYYPLDGNVQDESGNTYDGTVGGTETYGAGHSGQAFSFDGTTNISTALDIDVSVEPQLTMGAWVYPVGSFTGMVLTHDDQGFDRSFLYSSDFLNPPGWIAFDGRDGGSNWFSMPAGTGWQFVAVVYDQDKQTVTLFVDGNAVTKEGQILGPSLNMFRIGNNESNGAEFFNGLVDEVFVVSGALSTAELDQIRLSGIRSMFP